MVPLEVGTAMQKTNEWYVDGDPKNLATGEYYDEIGLHEKTDTSLAIFDAPSKFLNKSVVSKNGKPVLAAPWSKQFFRAAEKANGGKEPDSISLTHFFDSYLVQLHPPKKPTVLLSYSWFASETWDLTAWFWHSSGHYGPHIVNGTIELDTSTSWAEQSKALAKYDDWK